MSSQAGKVRAGWSAAVSTGMMDLRVWPSGFFRQESWSKGVMDIEMAS